MKSCRACAALVVIIFFLSLGLDLPVRSQSQPQNALQQPLLKLNVLVLDNKNHVVTDLRQEDFQVFEGDAPQTISFFSKEMTPVSYGLLIDSSGSMRTQYMSVLEAGRTIISSNHPDDETFLIRFISSDKINLEQDFTADKLELRVKLNGFGVEGGQTAVIDAVYMAAAHFAQSKREETSRRRALILITDGEDRSSTFTKDELIKLLHQTSVQIFVIGLVNELDEEGGLTRKSPRRKAIDLLEELAKETGGLAFFPDSPSKLPAIADEIAHHLHAPYVIGYNPTVKADKDSSRKVRVKLTNVPGHEKLKVIFRPERPAPPSEIK